MAEISGIVLIDKPAGWTSHDVIAKLRGILHERRIGHSGTLDPMATGVLAVFAGRATRAVEFAEADEKEYIASARLGVTTDTQDMTGSIVRSCADFMLKREQIAQALDSFLGESEQLPPMYSAIKHDGKKLYELARKGVSVERKPRRIFIREIELLAFEKSELTFRVVCSKGTYVRTIANDLGEKLGCGAALSALKRTRAGNFKIAECVTLEEAAKVADSGRAEELLRPVDSLFADKKAFTIPEESEKKCRNGSDFAAACKDGLYRVYSETGEFLMLGSAEGGVMHTVKSFFEPQERI